MTPFAHSRAVTILLIVLMQLAFLPRAGWSAESCTGAASSCCCQPMGGAGACCAPRAGCDDEGGQPASCTCGEDAPTHAIPLPGKDRSDPEPAAPPPAAPEVTLVRGCVAQPPVVREVEARARSGPPLHVWFGVFLI